jgi:hypothetical protein
MALENSRPFCGFAEENSTEFVYSQLNLLIIQSTIPVGVTMAPTTISVP